MFKILLTVLNCILIVSWAIKYFFAKEKSDRIECLLWMMLVEISWLQL